MTDKEKRIENYRKQRQAMLAAGYEEYQGTISVLKANLYALITAGPFAALAIILYILDPPTDCGFVAFRKEKGEA